MILSSDSSFYGFPSSRRFAPADDEGPQPVAASTTLRQQLPEVFPSPAAEAGTTARRTGEDEQRDAGEARHNRRRSDRQPGSGQQNHDRRQQNLPTLIDTRSTRTRRRNDRQEVIDFVE